MKDGFLWCMHCGSPHDLKARFCPSTGAPIDRAMHRTALKNNPMLGRIVDARYRVIELIGRGGKGFVFGAEDLKTGGHVAIKIVTNPEASEAVRRLEREATLAASLRHPHICSLLDMGWIEGVGPYIVMERLFGETLSQSIRDSGPLALDTGIDLMLQVLSGLDAAHSMNVVHRDIKPSNIFITGREGMPPIAKVLDFGYARKTDGPVSRLTRPGIMVGTRRYLAPEVRLGGEVTHLSDLFACGMVLFEMLTAKIPYRGKTVLETEAAIVKGDRRWLLAYRPEAPTSLAWLVHYALSPNPEDRLRSAREFYAELRKIASALKPKLTLLDPDDEEPTSTIRRSPSRAPTREPSRESWAPPAVIYDDEPSSSSGRR